MGNLSFSCAISFMMNLFRLSCDFDFNFHFGRKHALCRFVKEPSIHARCWQQGEYGDKQSDLTLGGCELPVESLGHCQSVGNWIGKRCWLTAVAHLASLLSSSGAADSNYFTVNLKVAA